MSSVWLYFRFPLSLRMVEDLLAALEMNGTSGEGKAVRHLYRRLDGQLVHPKSSDLTAPTAAGGKGTMRIAWSRKSRRLSLAHVYSFYLPTSIKESWLAKSEQSVLSIGNQQTKVLASFYFALVGREINACPEDEVAVKTN